MAKYRARSCPHCNYFVGFSITKPLFKRAESLVTSFCLNCNYKLPIHRVVRGVRRPSPYFRPRNLRLLNKVGESNDSNLKSEHKPSATEILRSPQDYARHLRVLGQELENRRFSAFNLECTGQDYWVWARAGAVPLRSSPFSRLGKTRLQKLWENNIQFKTREPGNYLSSRASRSTRRFRYSLEDIDRLERNEHRRRRGKKDLPPRHSLSQLLRAVGALVTQRGDRLLGICWQELSIGIVAETPQGKREIEVFRPDNLYDLNAGMHFRRDYRALSDRPH